MRKERRIYEIHVNHIDEKDVKQYMKDVVTKMKSKIIWEPGIVYAPYVPVNIDTIVEGYFPKQKILKVKEWLKIQAYSKKTVNQNFYSTANVTDIPEINLKMESRTIEGGMLKKVGTEWKAVAGVVNGKINSSSELTKEESDFNAISKELKKRGI